jgi:hypothetical protein
MRNYIFKNLEDIQFILTEAVFKEDGLTVTPFLRDFVYDRIDDIAVKQRLYQKLKSTTKVDPLRQ